MPISGVIPSGKVYLIVSSITETSYTVVGCTYTVRHCTAYM